MKFNAVFNLVFRTVLSGDQTEIKNQEFGEIRGGSAARYLIDLWLA